MQFLYMKRLERFLGLFGFLTTSLAFIPYSFAQTRNNTNMEIELNFVNTRKNETSFTLTTPTTSYSNVLKKVQFSDLLGNSPTPFEVVVPPSGVNISLIGTEWSVKKLWLDSPGFSLDFDGCLSGNSSLDSRSSNKCEFSAAQVLHIVPDEDSNSPFSMLTIIVSSSIDNNQNEKRKLLIIRLTKGQSSDYVAYNYEISDNYNLESITTKRLNIIEQIKEFRVYSRGVQAAIDKQFIVKNGSLHQKLKAFLVFLQQGNSIDSAASKTDIDLQVIEKIHELGLN
jgi:hypothetical protein